MEEELVQNMQTPESQAGRGTDTVMAHMTIGEVVIPREFMQDPDFAQMLFMAFEAQGGNIAEFTVGDPANKINPETGYPEFGWFKKLLSFALPVLGTVLGGPVGGAIGGALGGGLSGGGLRGALLGGAAGGIGAGISGASGSLFSPGSAFGSTALGSSLNALNTSAIRGLAPISRGLGSLVGSLPGKEVQGPLQPGAASLGTGQGTGIAGALGRAVGLSADTGVGGLAAGSGGGSSSFSPLSLATNVAGGLQSDTALKKAKEQQLASQGQQLSNLESFDPSGIKNDPGYEFNRAEGEKGINRSLGAEGNLFSGRALKAASEYNQNYADNAFKDYYQRWQNKVGAQNQLYGNQGDINANATVARSNNLAQSLSNAFGTQVGGYGGTDLNSIRRRLGLVG